MKFAPRSLSRDPGLERQLTANPHLEPFVHAMEWAIQHGQSPLEREQLDEENSIGVIFSMGTRFADHAVMVSMRFTRGREITEIVLLEVLVPQ